jgi:hypothetical protein
MLIAFDYDDTLADWRAAFAKWMLEQGNIAAKRISRSADYDMADVWPQVRREEMRELIRRFSISEAFSAIPLFRGAKAVPRKLIDHGIRSAAITAPGTDPRIADARRVQLERLGLISHEILPQGAGKIESMRRMGCDVLVDDSPKVLREAIDAGIPVVVRDRLHNRHIDAPRIFDWTKDIEVLVKVAEDLRKKRRRVGRKPNSSIVPPTGIVMPTRTTVIPALVAAS